MALALPRISPAWSPLWGWLLPLGAFLAVWIWPKAEAVRPPTSGPIPAPTVAVPPTAEESDRRLAGTIARAVASTVALEYGDKDPSGRLRVATGVVINARGDVLSIRADPPEPAEAPADGQPRPSTPEIRARDAAGHVHPARWIAADAETGLTLLRVDADDIRPIAPADREPLLGEEVLVIGTPYGLGQSVSRGHVAGLGRRVQVRPWPLGGLIQVQAPIHPGDSGALLADLDGRWLGLVRGILMPDGPPKGPGPRKLDDDLGFAIAARDACWVADRLLALGRVDRAYLGVRLAPEAPTSAGPDPGAEVTDVVADSPAARGGLRAGDRIVALDHRPIRTTDDLTDRLDWTPAHADVALEVARPGFRETLARTVRTAARRALAAVAPAAPSPRCPSTPSWSRSGASNGGSRTWSGATSRPRPLDRSTRLRLARSR